MYRKKSLFWNYCSRGVRVFDGEAEAWQQAGMVAGTERWGFICRTMSTKQRRERQRQRHRDTHRESHRDRDRKRMRENWKWHEPKLSNSPSNNSVINLDQLFKGIGLWGFFFYSNQPNMINISLVSFNILGSSKQQSFDSNMALWHQNLCSKVYHLTLNRKLLN